MTKNVKTLKNELKKLAEEIRTAKKERKSSYTGERVYTSTIWKDYEVAAMKAQKLSDTFRHMHIAYCLLRGRSIEEVEPKNRKDNEPNMSFVHKIMKEYDWSDEEKAAYLERKKLREVA